jgi:histidine triad (HIT) family protein
VTDCLFCGIVAGEIDADIVRESDGVIAFRDINPVAPTHILVIPREHLASIQELEHKHKELLGEVFAVIDELAAEEGLSGGHRVVTNVGSDAGQSVPHLHWHLLGGRAMAWPPG